MMNTGNSCRGSRKESSARAAERLRRILGVCCCAVLAGCGGESPQERPAATTRPSLPSMTVTPSEVRIGDLTLYQTRREVLARHPRMVCRRNDMGDQVCAWNITPAERKRGYEGISAVTLSFVDDRLHEIVVAYGEMFDVEYSPFASKLIAQWGGGAASSDTVIARWSNDSLAITLQPKRKMHWTRTAYAYTPTITYRERMLRR